MIVSTCLVFLCFLTVWGQSKQQKSNSKSNSQETVLNQETLIKKHIIVDEIENQLKDVPFVAVRAFVRIKTAAWLWKDGKDETGRAENLVIKAIDELYENKMMEEFPALRSEAFYLLDANSKETAKRLAEKYGLPEDYELDYMHLFLNKKDGDKIIAERVVRLLNSGKEVEGLEGILGLLMINRSQEVAKILTAIVSLEESGRRRFSIEDLDLFSSYLRELRVPDELRERFYNVVLNRVRNSLVSISSNEELTSSYYLLAGVISDIRARKPSLFPEANALLSQLGATLLKQDKETIERDKRIEESLDKLEAIISEAEKAEKIDKFRLYNIASVLALRRQKLRLAVDLAEKALNVEGIPEETLSRSFREGSYDQFLRTVVNEALQKEDVDSSLYAVKKMIKNLSKAESLIKVAKFYQKKKDDLSALYTFEEALRLAQKADEEGDVLKVFILCQLASLAQEIDRNRISGIMETIAKTINNLPAPSVDDKPESENYKKYVRSVMATYYNLFPVVSKLAREDAGEVMLFANRINKKEIRVLVNYALLTESFKVENKPKQ